MSNRILVAFDGSPWAHSAALMAGWLAQKTQASVLVLQAVELPEDGPRSTLAVDFRNALAAVDKEVASLSRRGIRAEGTAAVGDPVRRIMRAIQDQSPSIVALGTLGDRPFESWLVGSVANKVARSAPCPVLLMPQLNWEPPPTSKRLRVLVPMDGSHAASGALTAIEALGSAVTRNIMVLQVVEHPHPKNVYTSLSTALTDGATYEQVVTIAHNAARQIEPGVALRIGQPAGQIVQFAQDGDYDLIALTRHGRGGIAGMLLGAVAEGVVKRSSVPVLVTPPAPAMRHDVAPLAALHV